ncbi:TPA: hypothetical protein ACQQX6_001652 [Yersinia enterocolitica]|uniref:hypothetical protein n=1 Tax=Yersinia enterocolitica TaxID=630 RepID=UPI0003D875BB|nr:hypothetical protein [Yersinia enterocolitica]EKN4712559.1 hypothetical protein [Yersinia enterocolitica]EME3604231.1 hypothetical protein [Yersinia enterocolitica]CCQ39939.1 hypothetical protein YE5303_12331 [Yersinia enterocolitica (type O:5) str. YE53/03]HDL6521231.1 hypothetical protein [Yersinia enterocolitica]HDL6525922.1 hypothetical protein [Yersinia enterocolitica]
MFLLESLGFLSTSANELTINIKSDIAWEALLGSLITSIAVVISVFISLHGIKKTIKSQERIAKSANWNIELRECCSEYVGLIFNLMELQVKRLHLDDSSSDYKFIYEEISSYPYKMNKISSQIRMLLANDNTQSEVDSCLKQINVYSAVGDLTLSKDDVEKQIKLFESHIFTALK